MSERIPQAVWEGEFSIAGVPLKCAVLDDGSRIIEAESLRNFFTRLSMGDCEIRQEDLSAFSRWQAGL